MVWLRAGKRGKPQEVSDSVARKWGDVWDIIKKRQDDFDPDRDDGDEPGYTADSAIEILRLHPREMELCIQWADKKIKVTAENVEDLLKVGDRFDIQKMKKEAHTWLLTGGDGDVSVAFDCFVMAVAHGLEDVEEKLQPTILDNMKDFCETHMGLLIEKSPEKGLSAFKLSKAFESRTADRLIRRHVSYSQAVTNLFLSIISSGKITGGDVYSNGNYATAIGTHPYSDSSAPAYVGKDFKLISGYYLYCSS